MSKDRMRAVTATLQLLVCVGIWQGAAIGQSTVLALRVRDAALAGDFNGARQLLAQIRSVLGPTAQYAEALSWLGRGELGAKDFHAADQNAAEVRKLCLDLLAHRKLDAEPALPLALGAAIEIQAQAAVAQGRRDEAVVFLREEAKRWYATSLRPRIQKNLNLLTLEGKPAPPLAISQAVTGRKLRSLAQHRGHPVLLFFWAHWCADCKSEIAVVGKLEREYGKRGLTVIAPTQHYGYAAGGEDASPAAETAYIKAVFAQYYAELGNVETPLSEENFALYGVSTTPTMVLIDGRGIVRLYHPGVISYEELAAKIEAVLQTV